MDEQVKKKKKNNELWHQLTGLDEFKNISINLQDAYCTFLNYMIQYYKLVINPTITNAQAQHNKLKELEKFYTKICHENDNKKAETEANDECSVQSSMKLLTELFNELGKGRIRVNDRISQFDMLIVEDVEFLKDVSDKIRDIVHANGLETKKPRKYTSQEVGNITSLVTEIREKAENELSKTLGNLIKRLKIDSEKTNIIIANIRSMLLELPLENDESIDRYIESLELILQEGDLDPNNDDFIQKILLKGITLTKDNLKDYKNASDMLKNLKNASYMFDNKRPSELLFSRQILCQATDQAKWTEEKKFWIEKINKVIEQADNVESTIIPDIMNMIKITLEMTSNEVVFILTNIKELLLQGIPRNSGIADVNQEMVNKFINFVKNKIMPKYRGEGSLQEEEVVKNAFENMKRQFQQTSSFKNWTSDSSSQNDDNLMLKYTRKVLFGILLLKFNSIVDATIDAKIINKIFDFGTDVDTADGLYQEVREKLERKTILVKQILTHLKSIDGLKDKELDTQSIRYIRRLIMGMYFYVQEDLDYFIHKLRGQLADEEKAERHGNEIKKEQMIVDQNQIKVVPLPPPKIEQDTPSLAESLATAANKDGGDIQHKNEIEPIFEYNKLDVRENKVKVANYAENIVKRIKLLIDEYTDISQRALSQYEASKLLITQTPSIVQSGSNPVQLITQAVQQFPITGQQHVLRVEDEKKRQEVSEKKIEEQKLLDQLNTRKGELQALQRLENKKEHIAKIEATQSEIESIERKLQAVRALLSHASKTVYPQIQQIQQVQKGGGDAGLLSSSAAMRNLENNIGSFKQDSERLKGVLQLELDNAKGVIKSIEEAFKMIDFKIDMELNRSIVKTGIKALVEHYNTAAIAVLRWKVRWHLTDEFDQNDPYKLREWETRLDEKERNLKIRKKELDLKHRCLKPLEIIGMKLSPKFNKNVLVKLNLKIENLEGVLDINEQNIVADYVNYTNNLLHKFKYDLSIQTDEDRKRFENIRNNKSALEYVRRTNKPLEIDLVKERNDLGKFDDSRETMFRTNYYQAIKMTRDSLQRYRQYHFDFLTKTLRRDLKYLNKWRRNAEFSVQLEPYLLEIGKIDNKLLELSERSRKFMMNTFMKTFTKQISQFDLKYLVDNEEQLAFIEIANRVRNEIEKCNNLINTYYKYRITLIDTIFDRQFILSYAIKVLCWIAFAVCVNVIQRQFTRYYTNSVYVRGQPAPSLLLYVVFSFMLYCAFFAFLFIGLGVLFLFYKKSTNSFIVDSYLLQTVFADFAFSSIVVMAISLTVGGVIQRQNYFNYNTEGARAVRFMKSIMQYIAMVVFVLPFFFHLG